jgi:hypothetical protein
VERSTQFFYFPARVIFSKKQFHTVKKYCLLFEAGALSKFQKESRVWTFLLDLKSENINGPLAKFQHTNFEKKEILQLLQSINKVTTQDRPIKDELLVEIFDNNWERLNQTLLEIKAKGAVKPEPLRDPLDISIEVLEVVRKQENITQKLIKQNEEITRYISQIACQIPRGIQQFQPPSGYGTSGNITSTFSPATSGSATVVNIEPS